MRGRTAARRALAAFAAAALLPGCDTSWSFKAKEGDSTVEGRSDGAAAPARALRLLPPAEGGLPPVLPDGEAVLRFSAPLDPAAARGAVRVEDEGRPGVPVPVEVGAREGDLVLRPAGPGGWRPGASLLVRVAGLPSLRALRSAEGDPLREDAEARFAVRSSRRRDRVAPVLVGSDPAAGASGVDPASPVVLRFSEAMDPRTLSFESRGSPWEAARLEADGRPVPFRSFLDRARRELTLLPAGGLPPSSSVAVEIADRARDSTGNRLSPGSVHRVEFRTGPAGDGSGRLVEAFEDARALDPLGTTVRWNHPAEPGVLSGVLEPRALETGLGAEERVLRLDPLGGSLLFLVSAEELGDEPRVLRTLHLALAPGAVSGEILEPRVRAAAAVPFAWEEMGSGPGPWMDLAEGIRGGPVRGPGGAIPLVFRHPCRHDGATALLFELSWKATAGEVFLRASRQEETRCLLRGAGPEAAALRVSPLVRFDAVGERAVARSLWLEAEASVPSWQEPVLLPPEGGGGAAVRLQGAPDGADGSGPDPARATPWTEDPAALAGMRWIRFRVLFGEPGPGEAPAALDRIDLPHAGR